MADAAPAPPLLLASRSPQRRAILEQLGVPFEVLEPRYEEHTPELADAAHVTEHVEFRFRLFPNAPDDLFAGPRSRRGGVGVPGVRFGPVRDVLANVIREVRRVHRP